VQSHTEQAVCESPINSLIGRLILSLPFTLQLLCPSIPTLFSTFLSAFFDFTVLHPHSHSIAILHSMCCPSFSILPLHSLFISLSIATPVHSSILSSFNYSVHQFLHFFQLFCQPSLTLQSAIVPSISFTFSVPCL